MTHFLLHNNFKQHFVLCDVFIANRLCFFVFSDLVAERAHLIA